MILFWLQDLGLLKWLQGLNRQPLANTGAWLSALLPPGPQELSASPQPAATEPTGPASAPGPRGTAGGAAPVSALGAGILIGLKARSHSEQLKEARSVQWTTTSSDLWKHRRCSVTAQDSVTAGATQEPLKTGEKSNQPKTFLESAPDSALLPTSPAALWRGHPRSPQGKLRAHLRHRVCPSCHT